MRYTLNNFVRVDFKAVETWLNERAAAGWEPEKFGLLFTRWKKSGRRDLRWCLDLTHSNRNKRADQRDYVELCREGGWELALLRSGTYCFRSVEGMDPPPVQTDPELERRNYNKYYIRSAILSVIGILAVLAAYALMFFAFDRFEGLALHLFRLGWHENWIAITALPVLALWVIWGLWRTADFIRAVIVNRDRVRISPRWIMWVNCGLNLAALAGAVALFAACCLEGPGASLYGCVIGAIFCIGWQWFSMEFELYRGERRTMRSALILFAAALAVMIFSGLISPSGQWGKGERGFSEHYAMAEEQPVLRSEDLGLEGEAVPLVKREFTPVGEVWQVRDLMSYGDSWERMESKSWLCDFDWQTQLTLSQTMAELEWWADPANRAELPGYLVVTAPIKTEVVPDPIALDWADEAWYGQWETGSVLLVRIGRQVTRIIAPVRLADHWTVVENRFCR